MIEDNDEIQLDKEHQEMLDDFYLLESEVLIRCDLEMWTPKGKADIEKGFMALRKAVTLHYVENKDK
ncbi:MAG: hypothetical protein QN834_07130 [Nitrososphaeraceae archaeon]|nr:hypothetical protein [Nitrososphaeraceae archaeon]